MSENQKLVREDQMIDYDSLNNDVSSSSSSTTSPLSPINTRSRAVSATSVRKTSSVYKIRWYVLLMFCFLAVLQGMVLTTYGPIQQFIELSVGWTLERVISLNILMWATLVITSPISTWLVLKNGLQWSVIGASASLSIGNVLRCLANKGIAHTFFSYISSMCIGIFGSVLLAGGPILAKTWFPDYDIGVISIITVTSPYLGVLLSFIIEPWLYSDIKMSYLDNGTNIDPFFPIDINENILYMKILYAEAAVSTILFMIVMSYYPNKPELPPTDDYCEYTPPALCRDILKLFKKSRYLCILVALGVCLGILTAWSSTLAIVTHNTVQRGYIQRLEMSGIVLAIAAALLTSSFTIKYESRSFRLISKILLIIALIGAICFAVFVTVKGDTNRDIELLICNAVIAIFLSGTVPFLITESIRTIPCSSPIVLCAVLPVMAALVNIVYYVVLLLPFYYNITAPFTLITLILASIASLFLHPEQNEEILTADDL